MRLEIAQEATDELVEMIVDQEELRVSSRGEAEAYNEVYRIPGPLDLTGLMSLLRACRIASTCATSHSRRKIATGLRRHGEDIFSADQPSRHPAAPSV